MRSPNFLSFTPLILMTIIISLIGAISVSAVEEVTTNYNNFKQQQKSIIAKRSSPLRVFVLVGQSNMVGHGSRYMIDETTGEQKNATLQWLVDNVPDVYGKLKKKKSPNNSNEVGTQQQSKLADGSSKSGKANNNNKRKLNSDDSEWTVRKDVLIACNSRDLDDLSPSITEHGNLFAGLCAGDPGQKDQVGPELGFGWAVGGEAFGNSSEDTKDDKVLIIKVAWGGKSLSVDFRPPSSGGKQGPYYTSVIDNIKHTMSNIKQIFPDEGLADRLVVLSGFAWHQGWNDGCNETMATEYQTNLANLIRDVRKDLNTPNLPFAIASTGMEGYSKQPERRDNVINAELKVATYPEFKGTVTSIDTRPFARGAAPASPTNFDYHWMCNAESYWMIGQSLGIAMVGLVNEREQIYITSASTADR